MAEGRLHTDHTMIRGGALLQADGGFLILEARDLLAEPGAWKMLLRSLRSGMLEIAPAGPDSPFGGLFLKPDPIPIHVKVVLTGEPDIYQLLATLDPDFWEIVKVRADLNHQVEVNDEILT